MENSGNILHIKNMVCNRCIAAVDGLLRKGGLHPVSVSLGVAVLEEPLDKDMREGLAVKLAALGFELLDDRKDCTVDEIRTEVIRLVHYGHTEIRQNLSSYLSGRMDRDYSYLSKLFSEVTGTTIEKYFIAQKIEKAKELLAYGEMSLDEIADALGYSSSAYLNSRFKSITGMTPGQFRKMTRNTRKPLDEV